MVRDGYLRGGESSGPGFSPLVALVTDASRTDGPRASSANAGLGPRARPPGADEAGKVVACDELGQGSCSSVGTLRGVALYSGSIAPAGFLPVKAHLEALRDLSSGGKIPGRCHSLEFGQGALELRDVSALERGGHPSLRSSHERGVLERQDSQALEAHLFPARGLDGWKVGLWGMLWTHSEWSLRLSGPRALVTLRGLLLGRVTHRCGKSCGRSHGLRRSLEPRRQSCSIAIPPGNVPAIRVSGNCIAPLWRSWRGSRAPCKSV